MWRLIAACVTGLFALVIFGLVVSAISTVGPNERLRSDPVEIADGARAIVLDEAIVPFGQTSVTLTVDSEQPVFVGAANGVDTESYLTGVQQQEITSMTFEGPIEHRAIPGEANLPAAPEDLDWWASSETGESVQYTFDLDAAPQTVVIAPLEADGTLDVSLAAELRATGVFGLSLAGAALGFLFLGLALYFGLSWWQNRLRPRPKRRPSAEDESAWRAEGKSRREQIAAAEKSRPASRAAAREDAPRDEDAPLRRRDRRRRDADTPAKPEAPPATPATPPTTPGKPESAPQVAASSPSEVPEKPQDEPFPTRRSRKNTHA